MKLHEKSFKKVITKTFNLNYLVAFPEGYEESSNKKWPLVLFLHGAGERGEDLELLKAHGIPKLISQGKSFPFISVSPQCPEDSWWTVLTDELNDFIDDLICTLNIDVDRVYLTGISMGGFGTWKLATEHPEKFAALAPICGGPWSINFFQNLDKIKDIPIWTFHGAKDDVVPISGTEQIVSTLKELGSNVKFTVYPEANHDSWTVTYENPELFKWLLNQHK